MNMRDLNVTINSSDVSDNSSDITNDLTEEQYISNMTNIVVRPILVLFGTISESLDPCVYQRKKSCLRGYFLL